MKLFKGSEAEGHLKGRHTLFVEGSVPLLMIMEQLNSAETYQQVYFGAGFMGSFGNGGLSKLNINSILRIAEGYSELVVTIETNKKIVAEVMKLKNVNIMLHLFRLSVPEIVDYYEPYKDRVQVRLDTKSGYRCIWLKDFIFNNREVYKDDTLIWSSK